MVFTGLLVVVGLFQGAILYLQYRQFRRTNDSAEMIERAYVKLADRRPGLTRPETEPDSFDIEVKIANHGRTPAKITAVHLELKYDPLQVVLNERPAYTAHEVDRVRAFLVANSEYLHRSHFANQGLPRVAAVVAGQVQMWIIGYVDYIDKFSKRYRSGYARRYDHTAPATETNLAHVEQDGYNYDRERDRSEGNDWNE